MLRVICILFGTALECFERSYVGGFLVTFFYGIIGVVRVVPIERRFVGVLVPYRDVLVH